MPTSLFYRTKSSAENDAQSIAPDSLSNNACYDDGLESSWTPKEQSAFTALSTPWVSHAASNTAIQDKVTLGLLNPYSLAGNTAPMSLPLESLANLSLYQAWLTEGPAVNRALRAVRGSQRMQMAIELRRKCEDSFECSICQRWFTKHSKDRHVYSHYGVRYPCRYCDATFSTRGDCRRHEKMKHGQ